MRRKPDVSAMPAKSVRQAHDATATRDRRAIAALKEAGAPFTCSAFCREVGKLLEAEEQNAALPPLFRREQNTRG